MSDSIQTDRGAAAVMVAGALVFLFGTAALAVDTSGFYQTARVGQSTADLACLAGVAELPDRDKAIDMAVAYTEANWPEMAGGTRSANGPNSEVLADGNGNGNEVVYTTPYGGNSDVMHTAVLDRDPTTFGRVLGTDSVDISQQAACEREEKRGGPGALPMGALPGTFHGNLHDCANKVTGNCGALDVGSGGNDWRDAIAQGWDQQLEKHHGNRNTSDPDTGHVVIDCPTPGPCSSNLTETGNMQGPFEQGTGTRFGAPGHECTLPGPFNCDSMADIFGSQPPQLSAYPGSEPSWWEEGVYGDFAAAQTLPNHYYFSGDLAHCDSPRLGMIPIVAHNLDWDTDDAPGTWPNGKKDMKVIGFYLAYIRTPATPAQLGSMPIQADIVHIAPGATCDGAPFELHQTGVLIESVKLVQP